MLQVYIVWGGRVTIAAWVWVGRIIVAGGVWRVQQAHGAGEVPLRRLLLPRLQGFFQVGPIASKYIVTRFLLWAFRQKNYLDLRTSFFLSSSFGRLWQFFQGYSQEISYPLYNQAWIWPWYTTRVKSCVNRVIFLQGCVRRVVFDVSFRCHLVISIKLFRCTRIMENKTFFF